MAKPKMSALVTSAIRNLREIRGSTSKEIMNYIRSQYTGVSDANIQKQIYTALKRGLDYGILKRDHGYYSLNMDPDMLYKAPMMSPLEQGRRRRRRRRRHSRGVSRRRRPRRRRRRPRRRRRRRRRARRRRRSRGRHRHRRRSLTGTKSVGRCRRPSKNRTEDTLRKSPMTSLRKGMTYLYKGNQSPESRQLSRSRERSQTRSRSTSSEKEMDDRDRDHS
ncbi:hypothetical protein HN011_005947 [Eciton burchellii]|nr:hypothetical protein HN011_005947 [Eciton burchellii]